jgi:large subunit ribosomal protein L6
MSRIGKMPVPIPNNVKVEIKQNLVLVEGPKGKLSEVFSPLIDIAKDNEKIVVKRSSDEKFHRALHGTTRNLIANMIKGVTEGFQKELEIIGVGYSAKIEGKKLVMKLGFSHPVEYMPSDNLKLEVKKTKNFEVIISGPSKQEVGQAACEIRKFCPPNAYKGKGIRYKGEHIKLKPGKTAATGAAGAGG